MLGGWHRRELASPSACLCTLVSSYSIWVYVKICVHNTWSECHVWHVCLLCPYAEWYLKYENWVCKRVCVCVCTHIAFFLALPMYGQEIALAIFPSPAYLMACLEVLVQKIETTLWKYAFSFSFPFFQICTSHAKTTTWQKIMQYDMGNDIGRF